MPSSTESLGNERASLSDIAPRLERARDQYREWYTKPLEQQIGRRPNFGDEFAHVLGHRVEDDAFQEAMRQAVYEVTGEEW